MITIDELIAGSLPASRDEALALGLALAAATSRLAVAFAAFAGMDAPGEDRLLDIDEAARRLSVDRQWIYRRTKKLPFVVRLDGAVRYSAAGIDAYIAAKRAR